ncbi:MAG: hypothetical protein MHM6MM_009656, partial [Cercozoa sp. M6MM]
FRIASLLAKRHESPSIFAVGDLNQSIYAWRGATPDSNFSALENGFDTGVFEQNYRSTESIQASASSVIKHYETTFDTVDDIVSGRDSNDDEPVNLVELPSREIEAKFAAKFLSCA